MFQTTLCGCSFGTFSGRSLPFIAARPVCPMRFRARSAGVSRKPQQEHVMTAPQVYRRLGPLPIFVALKPHFVTGGLLQLKKVDPVRLQCRAKFAAADGTPIRQTLRFATSDIMEEWLERSPTNVGYQANHSCTCCLGWIHMKPERCATCKQPMHRTCADKWGQQSSTCPACRAPWQLRSRTSFRTELASMTRLSSGSSRDSSGRESE